MRKQYMSAYEYLTEKPDIFREIYFYRDKLGFYAEIQNIFRDSVCLTHLEID